MQVERRHARGQGDMQSDVAGMQSAVVGPKQRCDRKACSMLGLEYEAHACACAEVTAAHTCAVLTICRWPPLHPSLQTSVQGWVVVQALHADRGCNHR